MRRKISGKVLLACCLVVTLAARPSEISQHAPPTTAPGPDRPVKPRRVPRTVQIMLTAAPARVSLLPDQKTDVFAYNGQVPGPTLEAWEGDTVRVHFRNQLPEPTSVHWHGLHIPFEMDGSPFHPVAPGDSHDYVFTIGAGTAGTYWYHPHPGHNTGHQVGMGLYGAFVVRALEDPLPPASFPEQVLVLSDSRFGPDGSIDFPARDSHQARIDFENGREGSVLFVNGRILPTIEIRSGEVQRWRIVNASSARVFRLSLSGHTFLHVGSDGGLFERPVEVRDLTVANAERVEVLVRGSGKPGERAVLQSLPYDRYVPQTRPSDWSRPRDLLTLQYSSSSAVAPPPLPAVLRSVSVLDTSEASMRRVMVLTQGFINGTPMDMDRVDVSASLGATEIWEVENLVGMDHPFHLHGFRFQVLDRNGVPEPFRQWKDVVNVPRHESARFIVRFDDYPGKWMFHCHILTHEDQGMMGVLEVK